MVRRYENEERKLKGQSPNSLDNLNKQKVSWSLSKQTRRKISDSVSLLNELSPARTIWASSKKPIYNFRTSFVTLTLPSAQIHTDTEIKSRCLNNFLTTMRQKFNLRNYVWKAELQQNENIHFHIVWDLYIHHAAVRYYWNKSLELLGYVSEYQNRYCNMSLPTYAKSRGKEPMEVIKAFRQGRDTLWKSPPTEQVIAVKNSRHLSAYLRKYLIKDNGTPSETSQNRLLSFGRVWGRSESISKIQFSKYYVADNLLEYIATLGDVDKIMHKMTYDYVTVYYFNFKQATKPFLSWLNLKMSELGTTYGYLPSG